MSGRSIEDANADLIQSLGAFVRRVRAAAAGQELSLTEASVLARLAREGPATTAELARAEGMKPQSMGTTVAALEEAGLLARKPHPTDGRQMHLVLTPAGTATREKVRQAKLDWLTRAVGQLDPQEQETLFAAGKIMRRLVAG